MTAAILIAALGQTWTWHAEVDSPVMDPGKGVLTQQVTLSVSMEHDTPYYIVGYSIFDTIIVGGAGYGAITDWKVLNSLAELTGDLTTTDGESLYGTNIGQLCTFTVCNHDNPLEVLEFTWELTETLDAPLNVTFATDTHDAAIWAGDDQDSAVIVDVEVLNEVAFTWTVLPAPAPFALAVGAFTVVARRRRS